MTCPSYEHFFKTLGSKTRLDILKSLRESDKNVSEICTHTNQEQSKVSHELKKLSDCNVVEVKQEGKQRIYSLNKETIVPILKLVDQHVAKNCKHCCTKEITKIEEITK
jgi:ArsR family transcriptional regulator